MSAASANPPPDVGDLEATEPTALAMRRAMGAFGTGVTIVSGIDGEGPVGFACQSFASASLDPPLVLFCADHRGRSWPRIRRSGRFTVNVLGEEQHDLCARFGSPSGARFADLDWSESRWGTPALPGVLMRAHCDVETVHVAGDHDLVIGRVLELETRDDGQPLFFFRGRLGLDATGDARSWAWTHGWGWGPDS